MPIVEGRNKLWNMSAIFGVTYEKLAGLAHIQWPCTDIEDMGTPYLYSGDQLTTPSCYITRFLINTQGKNKH
ncbi:MULTISPECIES: hypothetical protein [Proteus]|uniref:Uncharacterized protein n=1 Tax=Proteus penneri TaxID=102862 RepID=A0A0G4QGK4_9GAMM|nr:MULTISPECIES: hypothetical protein [Proteus]EEG86331.1 hypothetical protein PROPEN_01322 [Proteus penneri ATCC 35198]MBJ2118283.1 hypothetical protein [Proteus penneri]MCX2587910.1 hypothetical protein [Proteus penneri]NBL77443.1 hypothetical protein [Proteus sp. G2672]NBL89386.1 hypothetical protein [Proteus sp. G2673]